MCTSPIYLQFSNFLTIISLPIFSLFISQQPFIFYSKFARVVRKIPSTASQRSTSFKTCLQSVVHPNSHARLKLCLRGLQLRSARIQDNPIFLIVPHQLLTITLTDQPINKIICHFLFFCFLCNQCMSWIEQRIILIVSTNFLYYKHQFLPSLSQETKTRYENRASTNTCKNHQLLPNPRLNTPPRPFINQNILPQQRSHFQRSKWEFYVAVIPLRVRM